MEGIISKSNGQDLLDLGGEAQVFKKLFSVLFSMVEYKKKKFLPIMCQFRLVTISD